MICKKCRYHNIQIDLRAYGFFFCPCAKNLSPGILKFKCDGFTAIDKNNLFLDDIIQARIREFINLQKKQYKS